MIMRYTWMNSALFVLQLFFACSAAEAATDVFMHPAGNDASASPTSRTSPLRTLEGVESFLKAAGMQGDINVCIEPGIYQDQLTRWNYYPEDGSITFQPSYFCGSIVIPSGSGYHVMPRPVVDIDDRPIFDGRGTQPNEQGCWDEGAWFVASNPRNLRFIGLHVRNYQSGLFLTAGSPMQGNNLVERSIFERIGTLWVPQFGTSPAAIDIVRSTDNIIRNNEFVQIENSSATLVCDGEAGSGEADIHMHALYIAHGSARNLITDNDMARVSGVAVKFRDGSGVNEMRRNTIAWSGPYYDADSQGEEYAAILDAYHKTGELPSCGLYFQDTRVGPGYYESYTDDATPLFGSYRHQNGASCATLGSYAYTESGTTAFTGTQLREWYESLEAVDCSDSTYQCPQPPVQPDPEPCGGNTGTICP